MYNFWGSLQGAVNTTFEILEDTTRIEQSEIRNEKSEIIYDLTGCRVEKMTRGVYIVGGKKEEDEVNVNKLDEVKVIVK